MKCTVSCIVGNKGQNYNMEALSQELTAFVTHAKRYTDTVIAVRKQEAEVALEKIGSCLHLLFQDFRTTATCSHCLPSGCYFFTAAPRVSRNKVPDNVQVDKVTCASVTVLEKSDTDDLALLNTAQIDLSRANKAWFPVNRSNIADLKRFLNCNCFIYGTFGEGVRYDVYPLEHLGFVETPIYAGQGVISAISPDDIIADFTERNEVLINSDKFPQLVDLHKSQGYRNIAGCSGSGLWVNNGTEYNLLGILRKPVEPIEQDRHPIRFIPIWKLVDLLARQAAKGK